MSDPITPKQASLAAATLCNQIKLVTGYRGPVLLDTDFEMDTIAGKLTGKIYPPQLVSPRRANSAWLALRFDDPGAAQAVLSLVRPSELHRLNKYSGKFNFMHITIASFPHVTMVLKSVQPTNFKHHHDFQFNPGIKNHDNA